ncbi:MAG: hypothetical protein M1839_008265 [Geoglossum umbratile]|nr:MAG: hypothetical protein M1839_008265 [Geoglossum umbratile]
MHRNPQIQLVPNDYRFYKPLSQDKNEIRIVWLVPGEGHEPIRCFLRHEHLDDEHLLAYEALSYCWGSLSDMATIELHHLCKDNDQGSQANGFPPNGTLDLPIADGKVNRSQVQSRKQDLSVSSNFVAAQPV